MKSNSFIALLIILSSIISQELLPIKILENSINRLNNQDVSFLCDIKIQSLSKDPTKLNFRFHSHWADSSNYYSYIKFNSPIDYKGTELWSHYSDKVIMKKRMPINNKIIDVEDNFEGLDLVNFLNLNQMFNEIQNHKLLVDETKFNKKEIYLIKSYKNNNKKKSIKFYIDKNSLCIYKIEWNNKRGILNKILLFEDWLIVDEKQFPKSIIYEDIKKGIKTTCKLDKINFNSLNNKTIDLINIGFKND